jgi:hypothetical protein
VREARTARAAAATAAVDEPAPLLYRIACRKGYWYFFVPLSSPSFVL